LKVRSFKLESSIFDESHLSAPDFIEWVSFVPDDIVFDANRPKEFHLEFFLSLA